MNCKNQMKSNSKNQSRTLSKIFKIMKILSFIFKLFTINKNLLGSTKGYYSNTLILQEK